MQSLASLWQIFLRQGSLPQEEADASLSKILAGFGKIHNARELFDSGRAGVKILLAATKTPEKAPAQDRIIDCCRERLRRPMRTLTARSSRT